jgi:hypothetical protein
VSDHEIERLNARIAELEAENAELDDRAMGAEHNEGMVLSDLNAAEAEAKRYREAATIFAQAVANYNKGTPLADSAEDLIAALAAEGEES